MTLKKSYEMEKVQKWMCEISAKKTNVHNSKCRLFEMKGRVLICRFFPNIQISYAAAKGSRCIKFQPLTIPRTLVKSGQVQSSQIKSRQVKLRQVLSRQVKLKKFKSGHVMLGQVKSSQYRLNHVRFVFQRISLKNLRVFL